MPLMVDVRQTGGGPLALAVARLMVREAKHSGLDMSVRRLISTLGGIEETVLLYQGDRGRLRARRMLTEMDPTQQRLYDLFGHRGRPTPQNADLGNTLTPPGYCS